MTSPTATPDPQDASWESDAICRQVDPELWFPGEGDNPRDAKRICARCPVRDACLEYALAHDERFGVWGGLSGRERRALSRGRTGRVAS